MEQNPDELIEAAKHLMKKSLYEEHARVGTAITFPYKYCYIISTCALPDPSYEKLVISLEKKLIDSIQKMDQPTNVARNLDQLIKRIVIIGPEVIEIEFQRQKQRQFLNIKIYGFVEARESYYNEVPKLLGINTHQFIDRSSDANRIRISDLSSPLDIAYHNIEVTHSIIFKDHLTESETGRRDEGRKLMQSLLKDTTPGQLEFEIQKLNEFEACEAA